jgi:hypothetical protein
MGINNKPATTMAIQIALCFGDVCSGFCSTALYILLSENLFLFLFF